VVESLDYAPVGGGSYHWIAADASGRRRFVTVDHLDKKPWLGDEREVVFGGLRQAVDTAAALSDYGLDFVVAPVRSLAGETVRRVGPHHAAALYPFVDGRAGQFGVYEPADRPALFSLLAALHRATSAVAAIGRRSVLDIAGRDGLDRALRELGTPWRSGPFAEPAREALARCASDIAALLALHDRLRSSLEQRTEHWVVTHGEPHAANLIRTSEKLRLVDWDTVALAPPERDLWMLADDSGDWDAEVGLYVEETGYCPDRIALDLYGLAWDLEDLAAFTGALRSSHGDTADAAWAYDGLLHCATSRPRWEHLLR
jgi:spectinomycin phosphotransferase